MVECREGQMECCCRRVQKQSPLLRHAPIWSYWKVESATTASHCGTTRICKCTLGVIVLEKGKLPRPFENGSNPRGTLPTVI